MWLSHLLGCEEERAAALVFADSCREVFVAYRLMQTSLVYSYGQKCLGTIRTLCFFVQSLHVALSLQCEAKI